MPRWTIHQSGVMGNLATLRGPFFAHAVEFIATESGPNKNGIHGFMEPETAKRPDPAGSPAPAQGQAIWNLSYPAGFKDPSLGWFAGNPAEPITATGFRSLSVRLPPAADQPLAVPPGAVLRKFARTFAELRMHLVTSPRRHPSLDFHALRRSIRRRPRA